MTKLKNKIKVIDSLPTNNTNKNSFFSIFIKIILLLVLFSIFFIIYIVLTPYINAIDINKITGKKTYITGCNTKDYIIINKDKSYSLLLTNKSCKQKHFEGNIIIKDNKIIFNKNIEGYIDNKYNILINNNIFESDKNE